MTLVYGMVQGLEQTARFAAEHFGEQDGLRCASRALLVRGNSRRFTWTLLAKGS